MNRPNTTSRHRGQRAAHRINHHIRAPAVRVLLDEQALGVMATCDALRLASEHGCDLVEIASDASPPVCRIVEYGRFKYDLAKQRARPWVAELKDIAFRPKTEEHDLEFKVRHVRRFLEEGHRVRITIAFRGRELAHPRTGTLIVDRVLARSADLAQVEAAARLEGRRMVLTIAPRPDVARRAGEARRAADTARSSA
jgi:translation initiation factor IF-3